MAMREQCRVLYAGRVRAMLVAAGFGTRLHPLTAELPKPALPVGNRPVAWYALDHLARSGFDEVVINTHHLGDRLTRALEPVCPAAIRARFVHEAEILGTGGGVRNAWKPQPGEDFVTVNAKLLFAPDLTRALAVHRESGAIATMVLTALPEGSKFTPIHVDADGRVRGIGGAAPGDLGAAPRRMFASVQILSERAYRDLPENGDIIAAAYRPWLARGEVVMGVTDGGPWMDVGVSLRHYLDANLALAGGRIRWPGIMPTADGSLVASSARLEPGSRVQDSIIGEGASVAERAELRRCVMWAETRAAGTWEDVVFTSGGQSVRAL